MVEPDEGQKMEKIQWNEIEDNVKILANKIIYDRTNNQYNSIYPIPRGGMIAAVMLSHRLKLPIVNFNGINSKTLIVDDINDKGETIKEIEGEIEHYLKLDKLKIAVLYERYTTSRKSDYFGTRVSHNDWLIFPWEIID